MTHLLIALGILLALAPVSARQLCTVQGSSGPPKSQDCTVTTGDRGNEHIVTIYPRGQRPGSPWTRYEFTHGGATNVWVTGPFGKDVHGQMSWVDPGTYQVIRVRVLDQTITYPSPR